MSYFCIKSDFIQNVLKVAKVCFGDFCMKFCKQKLSKSAQTGNTASSFLPREFNYVFSGETGYNRHLPATRRWLISGSDYSCPAIGHKSAEIIPLRCIVYLSLWLRRGKYPRVWYPRAAKLKLRKLWTDVVSRRRLAISEFLIVLLFEFTVWSVLWLHCLWYVNMYIKRIY